jgi:hypothetical protein
MIMDVLINELSLVGQYSSKEEFINNDLLTFIKSLKEIHSFSDALLFKKHDFWDCKISGNFSLYSLLFLKLDEVTRLKSLLSSLFDKPFWEDDKKHFDSVSYLFNGNCINKSSLAESCERDKIILSFLHKDFNENIILVQKGIEYIKIDNLFKEGIFTEILKERELICFEKYILRKFANSKLNFSYIDIKYGFNIIEKSDENEFYNSFILFNQMEWQQIIVNDGFDYKEFKDKSKFIDFKNRIDKFRITLKYRCFGYRDKDIFYVLRFETDHKLSDKG